MMKRTLPLLLMVAVAGCSSKDADLERFIAQTNQEPPGGVEPLPEVKPFDNYKYVSADVRSPFVPIGGRAGASSVRPDSRRNREFLEGFPLDSLQMVGTMSISGRTYGLVQTKDKLLQRVLPGNHLGENDGRITSIEPSKINIVEVVADGLGGYTERGTTLQLKE